MTTPTGDLPPARNIGHLIALIRPYWPSYAAALVCLTIGTVLFLLIPPQVGILIDTVSRAVGSGRALTSYPLRPALYIGGCLILQAVFTAIYTYLVAAASERVGNSLRTAFFRNAINRPMASTRPSSLGKWASEFSSDIAIIQAGVSDTLVNFLRQSIATVGAIGAMVWVDALMGALVLAAVALIVGITMSLITLVNRAAMVVQDSRARTVSLLVESIANAYVIQAYDRRAYFARLFDQRLAQVYRHIVSNIRLSAIVNPIGITIFAIGFLAILSFGLHRVLVGEITIANLFSFTGYTMLLIASVSQITVNFGALKLAAKLLDKHAASLGKAEVGGQDGEAAARRPGGAALGLELKGVSYRYPGAKSPVFEELDLAVPAGRITALIGLSGAGKSTIIALLVGLLRPDRGRMLTNTGEGAIRREDLAIVPQNPFLFAGTIAENIAFGRDWIDRRAIEEAAKAAQIAAFVRELPHGLDHALDEGGGNLSRGQQQRIALARALAGTPKLLILDEATASVDVVSERAIGRVLLDVRGSMTVLLVTHNGELLKLADEVAVLEGGRIRSPLPGEIQDADGRDPGAADIGAWLTGRTAEGTRR